jgi:hypothetical protein
MKQIASKQGVLIPDELDTSLDPLLPFAGRFVSPCSRRGPSVPAEYHRDRPRSADVAFVESHG